MVIDCGKLGSSLSEFTEWTTPLCAAVEKMQSMTLHPTPLLGDKELHELPDSTAFTQEMIASDLRKRNNNADEEGMGIFDDTIWYPAIAKFNTYCLFRYGKSTLNHAEIGTATNQFHSAQSSLGQQAPANDSALENRCGPEGGCRYWYCGVSANVEGVYYKVLAAMEDKEYLTFDAIKEKVKPETLDSTLSTWAHRANAILKSLNVPWKFTADTKTRMFRKKEAE